MWENIGVEKLANCEVFANYCFRNTGRYFRNIEIDKMAGLIKRFKRCYDM